jgi:hypothetical protein
VLVLDGLGFVLDVFGAFGFLATLILAVVLIKPLSGCMSFHFLWVLSLGIQQIQVRIKLNQVKISKISEEIVKYKRRMCRRLSKIA